MVNKKLVLIIVCTIALSNVAIGQNRTYVAESNNPQEFSISLILNEMEDKYCLLLGYWTSDDSYGIITVSYGSCEESRRKITTQDCKNGYKMVFKKRHKKELVVKKGLSQLLNMSFVNNGESTFDMSALFVAFDNAIEDRDKYQSQEFNHYLKLGQYCNGIYCMELFNDGQYLYTIRNIPISTGKFERIGCLLQFFDEELDEAFYAIIKPSGLESRFFPGELKGLPFKFQGE